MDDFVAYPSKTRIALLIVAAAGFVSLGFWMAGFFGPIPASHHYPPAFVIAVGWGCIVFFGFCGLFAVRRLFDSGERLRVGARGVCFLGWSDQTIPWSEITDVTIWTYKRQRLIILHLRDRSRYPGRGLAGVLAGANRALSGGDVSITLTGTDRGVDDALAAIARFRR